MRTRRGTSQFCFLRGLGDNEQFFIHSGAWNLVEDMREKGELGDFLIATAEGRSSFYIALNDMSVYAIRTTLFGAG
jgi:hypothetical protein